MVGEVDVTHLVAWFVKDLTDSKADEFDMR
jgi:hypothetical protein